MTALAFEFAGARFEARGSGALFWPDECALIVADLHLGKSERMARRGGALLPPFETRDTLRRLRDEVAASGAARLFSLGDAFDDDPARANLAPDDRAALEDLAACCAITWVSGNHDEGTGTGSLVRRGVTLRHIAGKGPDISGHYHPKARICGQRRAVFVLGATNLILPAFGTYTGGLDVSDAALAPYLAGARLIATGRRPVMLPASAVLRAG